MPRIPRKYIVYPGFQVHKIWRGHNREWNLGRDEWKLAYLSFLEKELKKSNSSFHALTLMDNHAHEIVHVEKQSDFSELMRRHHGRYGQYFNKQNGRSGKVAEDRPKTCLLEDDQAAMMVTFYVHANPYRAKMTQSRAVNYRFSTHRLYAHGTKLPWMGIIKFPKWYLNLGRTQEKRQRAYRKLFALYLRQTGHEKCQKYSKCFYGSVQWLVEKQTELKAHLKLHHCGTSPPS
jgi:putative transposase